MQPYTEQQWQIERSFSRQQMRNCQNMVQRIYECKSTLRIEALFLSIAVGLLQGVLKNWGKASTLKLSRRRYTKLVVKESMKRFDCMFGDRNDQD